MRALARWGITPLLAAPTSVWALGLGDIEQQSALNQPFRAEIRLSATPDELQGLRVMVAGAETFERYGLDRPTFLSSFEFRVVTARDGRSSIEVSSRESIAEPFVTLLLEVTWPRGRTLREYTVLLDPPVLLPTPAVQPAVQPAETRTSSGVSSGPINRPAAPSEAESPAAAPTVSEPAVSESAASEPAPSESTASEPPASPVSRAAPAPRVPAVELGGSYGPVQRAETLWAIANRVRPDGVSINRMMIAIFEANPSAFAGNINVLRAGATLRLPEAATLDSLAATAANAEVRRHNDEWRNRASQGGQLRLLPPSDTAVARTPTQAPAPAETTPVPASSPTAAANGTAAPSSAGNRPIEVSSPALQGLQTQAAATNSPAQTEPPAESAAPGVDLESEQVFTDETEPPAEPTGAETPAPVAVATPAPAPAEPSLVSQIVGWLLSPFLWIGLGVAALLLTALWFVRRRRQETEDVTGRWEALESETDDESAVASDATERMRRQRPEETIVVEEQHAERAPEPEPEPRRAAAASRAQPPPASQPQRQAAPTGDETLSTQTVINLDSADAVAEADFHIAYGLYDQAAELVQKALEAAPDRRDLKLKLLEVFFMWGNKDAFLKAAQALRSDIGQVDDPDWNKVVIMGRQICPDERLFTDATGGTGRVDVDLEAGDSPLDLAFDDAATAGEDQSGPAGLDFSLESSDQRPAPKPAAKAAPARDEEALDIGSRTAAGLEAALFEMADVEDTGRRTSPSLVADALAVTQESPTLERPGSSDWSTEAPTVETPAIGSAAARSTAIPRRGDLPTVDQPALTSVAPTEYTAEIDLDDLGLDVKDLEGLPADLGDLPMVEDRDTDTREQPALRDDDALLSATGVTKVLHSDDDDSMIAKTSVLEDQEATMLASGFDEGTSTMSGTAVLDGRHAPNAETGNTSLVKKLSVGKDAGVDLDLDDLTAALQGADTIEQPRTATFSRDVFGGGETPLDMEVGLDVVGDETPTGTEEIGLDPQTMTEVGTKLDLARAYIDMGDPEGARSILEEVLDEGDNNQRREAQGLIDVLSA